MDEAILATAKRHLKRVDPVMTELIRSYTPYTLARKRNNPYHALVQTIINQQLSVKAGATIFSRLLELQGGRVLKAEKLAQITDKQIQNCGVSRNKTRSIRAITHALIKKELNFKKLEKLDDEAAMAELIQYPGIGPWSAEIFLIASFNRLDILPIGDLVLRKSMQKHYALGDDAQLDDYLEIAHAWRPYRTVASRYLWAASQ